jgi:hypothetical protein
MLKRRMALGRPVRRARAENKLVVRGIGDIVSFRPACPRQSRPGGWVATQAEPPAPSTIFVGIKPADFSLDMAERKQFCWPVAGCTGGASGGYGTKLPLLRRIVLTVNSSWVHPLGRPALRLRRQAPPFLAVNPGARQVRLAV